MVGTSQIVDKCQGRAFEVPSRDGAIYLVPIEPHREVNVNLTREIGMSEKLSDNDEVQKKLDMICGRLSYALNTRYPKENYVRLTRARQITGNIVEGIPGKDKPTNWNVEMGAKKILLKYLCGHRKRNRTEQELYRGVQRSRLDTSTITKPRFSLSVARK